MRWRFWAMLGAMFSLAQGLSAQESGRLPVAPVPMSVPAAQPEADKSGSLAPGSNLPAEDFQPGELQQAEMGGILLGPQFYAELDYLIWWVSPNDLTDVNLTMVTQGRWSDPLPGALAQPNTIDVGPYPNFSYGAFKGGKLILGGWLDYEQTMGLEFSGVVLEQRSDGKFYDGNLLPAGTVFTNPLKTPLPPPLTPAINTNQTSTAALLKQSGVTDPAISSFTTHAGLQMWTSDINWMANWGRTEYQTFDLLFGFRQMQVQEGLNLYGTTVYQDPVNGQRTILTGNDSVATTNGFYGGQFGGRITERFGRFKLDVTGKLALGGVLQDVLISGRSTTTVDGISSTTTPGYVYTQPSNIGRRSARHFAVLPEIYTKLSMSVTERFHFGVGYSFLFLSGVARSGNQLDPVRNASQGRPSPLMQNDGFWAHGVLFTSEFQF